MSLPRVAFICVHNSCRSQLAEALGKLMAADVFESYSAGSEPSAVNPDAAALLRIRHGIDISGWKSKTVSEIPEPDYVVSMGCEVGCPYIGREFDENWSLADPTGKGDEAFLDTIQELEEKIVRLRERLR